MPHRHWFIAAVTASLAISPLLSSAQAEDSLVRNVIRCVEAGPFLTSDIAHFASKTGHRTVAFPSGERRVSVVAGYRVKLSTSPGAHFVNLKVERSAPEAFESDRSAILEQMTTFSSRLPRGEAELLRTNNDGIESFGLTQLSLNAPGPLSFYTLLAPKSVLVDTAYVLNQTPNVRAFKDMTEFVGLRDKALSVVANCLRSGA